MEPLWPDAAANETLQDCFEERGYGQATHQALQLRWFIEGY
jgi:hypothetical protein